MNKNILTEDEIKTIKNMRTPWSLSILENDDEETGNRIRKIIDMEIRCKKLVEMSSEPKKYTIEDIKEMSYEELAKGALREICHHEDLSGKTCIENNCCKLCNMKVFDISGEEIKNGLNNNIFPEYIIYRIIKSVISNYAADKYIEYDEDVAFIDFLYKNILDNQVYYINLSS